jgi:hypothetical protein
MALTILAIPFLFVGVISSFYTLDAAPCFTVGFSGKGGICFAPGSPMPEVIKYGCVAVGFALLYAGRLQINRRRGS